MNTQTPPVMAGFAVGVVEEVKIEDGEGLRSYYLYVGQYLFHDMVD